MRLTKCAPRLPLCGAVLVLVLQLLCCASGQNTPQSPCPQIFQYQFAGNEYFGLLQLTGIRLGQTVRINMVLTLREALPSSYPGLLDLYFSRDQTLQNVVANKPILYRIRFPVQHVLPSVVQIFVNNQLVCSGTPDGGSYVTSIKLEHTLQTQLSQPLAVDSGHLAYQIYSPETRPTGALDGYLNADQGNRLRPQSSIQSSLYPEDRYPLNQASQLNRPAVPSTVNKPAPPPRQTVKPPPRSKPPRPQTVSSARPQAPSEGQSEPQDERGGNKLEDVNKICGTTDAKFNVRPLVVGGEEIPRGSWPWLVAIYFNLPTSLAFQCGGSLISNKLVLTSAHCFYDGARRYTAQDVIVFLGRYNIRNWNETGTVAGPADGVYVHPDFRYNKQTFDADIALVLLKNDVRFTSLIRPVCLWPMPSITADIEGERGVVVGWGRNEAGQRTTSIPKKIETTIVSDLECVRSNEQFRVLTSNRTFCAGDRDGNGPCTGDSGGGLMLRRNNRWWLRGTVSASLADSDRSSCNLNEYVIFVDVSKFLSWIKSYMQI